jgi:uncharacterized membrane protein YccC
MEFMKKVFLPVVLIGLLLLLFKPIYIVDGEVNILYLWLLVGIPFGMRRMCLWLVPKNYGISGTVGIIAVNFIIGGLIGGAVAVFQLIQAVWYCLKCILPLFRKKEHLSC